MVSLVACYQAVLILKQSIPQGSFRAVDSFCRGDGFMGRLCCPGVGSERLRTLKRILTQASGSPLKCHAVVQL